MKKFVFDQHLNRLVSIESSEFDNSVQNPIVNTSESNPSDNKEESPLEKKIKELEVKKQEEKKTEPESSEKTDKESFNVRSGVGQVNNSESATETEKDFEEETLPEKKLQEELKEAKRPPGLIQANLNKKEIKHPNTDYFSGWLKIYKYDH